MKPCSIKYTDLVKEKRKLYRSRALNKIGLLALVPATPPKEKPSFVWTYPAAKDISAKGVS